MSKLAELVAVRVMGWRQVRKGNSTLWDDDATDSRIAYWMPHINILSAIHVADHFTDYEIAKGGESYTVTINGVFTATEKTKEMAITIAALRAVGVSDDRIEKARRST